MHDIQVLRTELRCDGGRCRGYARVRIPQLGIVIDGIRVLEKDTGGIYVKLPDQRNDRGEWFPAICFDDFDIVREIEEAVLSHACW